jgi:hypothetical protein
VKAVLLAHSPLVWFAVFSLLACEPKTRVFESAVLDAGRNEGGRQSGSSDAPDGAPASIPDEDGGSEPPPIDHTSGATLDVSLVTSSAASSATASSGPNSESVSSEPDSSDGQECTPIGDEDCFNGRDDDCNGFADCADSACAAGATCAPAGENMGVLIAANDTCPSGYSPLWDLHRELTGGPCNGCRCTPSTTECEGALHFYDSETACAADVTQSGGTPVDPVTFECPAEPLFSGFAYGYRVDVSLVRGTGSCTASGSATPMAAEWQSSAKYCVADRTGVGCQFGYACVPHQEAGHACAAQSNDTCASGTTTSDWYEGYSDTRACGECSCDGQGDCDEVRMQVGNDWQCLSDRPITVDGEQRCDVQHYNPPAQLVGTPTEPTCSPTAVSSGELTPEGLHALCCEN